MNERTGEVLRMIEEARSAEAKSVESAIALYLRARELAPGDLDVHNALERLKAPGRYGEWMMVDCTISRDDEIYRFFANHAIARNPIREYLSDGWRTLAELMLVLESADRSLTRCKSFLEFASGFGRFTRHLARAIPGRVTASDVQAESVDFVKERFGVEGFYSTLDPAELRIPGRYDIVFVLSMFTHLPPAAWGPWLRKLFSAVAPGGVLVFTVHNERRGRDLGVKFDAEGTHFIASSESTALDASAYGTTFTTRAFAENAVATALPRARVLHRDIAFWDGQDALVVFAPDS